MTSEIKNLEIIEVDAWDNPDREVSGITIRWYASIGFGEYTLYKQNNKWHADSECMDRGDDKSFGEMLLKKFMESVSIDG